MEPQECLKQAGLEKFDFRDNTRLPRQHSTFTTTFDFIPPHISLKLFWPDALSASARATDEHNRTIRSLEVSNLQPIFQLHSLGSAWDHYAQSFGSAVVAEKELHLMASHYDLQQTRQAVDDARDPSSFSAAEVREMLGPQLRKAIGRELTHALPDLQRLWNGSSAPNFQVNWSSERSVRPV